MKIISVVGTTQSGSTMVFNLIRICLINAGFKVDSCFITNYEENDYNKSADYLIIKCHEYSEKLFEISSQIFLPVRDVRDCVISWKHRYSRNEKMSFDELIKHMSKNIDLFNIWLKPTTIILKYEDYVIDKNKYIDNLLEKLGLDKNSIDLEKIFTELDSIHNGENCIETDFLQGNDFYDLHFNNEHYRKTLMTKSHNTSGGKIKKYLTEFSPIILYRIKRNKFILDHLKQLGYEQ